LVLEISEIIEGAPRRAPKFQSVMLEKIVGAKTVERAFYDILNPFSI